MVESHGKKKFAYDLWGDAVNTASRMESYGEAGGIHVSEEFKHAVETLYAPSLQFIRRGEIDIKGKGIMKHTSCGHCHDQRTAQHTAWLHRGAL